jgi:hypothetical protein
MLMIIGFETIFCNNQIEAFFLGTLNLPGFYYIIKSPKQSLGDLLFLLRFFLLLLLLFLFLFFLFSFLSADHALVHGRSQELLDRISWNLVEL